MSNRRFKTPNMTIEILTREVTIAAPTKIPQTTKQAFTTKNQTMKTKDQANRNHKQVNKMITKAKAKVNQKIR